MMNAGCTKAIGEFTTSTVSFVLTIKHCCIDIAHSNEEQNAQSSCRLEHFLHLYASNFSGVETILKIADGRVLIRKTGLIPARSISASPFILTL